MTNASQIRCSIPMCPNHVDRDRGGSRAVLAGREVFLCALHTAQARGAIVGVGKGLLAAAKQRLPGVFLAVEAAAKFHRASQLEPELAEDEPIYVEARVVR